MGIKGLIYVIKQTRYLKSIIKKYSGSLVSGQFVLHTNFRALSLKEPSVEDFVDLYFKKAYKSPRIMYAINKMNKLKTFVNRNRKTTAEYDVVYTSNNHDKVREVKLFSSVRKKILVICTSQEEKAKQLLQYDRFGSFYNMPKVKDNESYQNAFEISMVQLKDFPDERTALQNICNSTVAANLETKEHKKVSAEELTSFSYDSEMNERLEILCSKINKDVLSLELPFCVQHGDISKENLLYGEADGKTDFWWIDWEHARERVFFYDFFFYIINSALYYNTEAYDLYMGGKADEMLTDFFNHFGLRFDPLKRKDYLLIYMIDFLKERVCKFGRVSALREYVEFIETH